MNHITLLIIGSGPIGLSCAIAAKENGISYKLIDKGCLVNSIHNFPDEMSFFSSSNNIEIGNIPFSSLSVRPTKQEALEYYRRVAEHYELNISLYDSFSSMETIEEIDSIKKFRVQTSKTTFTCNFIVNATGFYGLPILLNIKGEKLPKVKHYFTTAHHLYKQKLVVIGASNSAIDVALDSYRKGADVSLIIRGDKIGDSVKYWVKPDIENRITEGSIKVYYNTTVKEIADTTVTIEQADKQITLENDFVYAMTGYKPDFNLYNSLGIRIDEPNGHPNHNEDTMETNTTQVFLAGVVSGGSNTRDLYIENTRDHGDKIMSRIKTILHI
jgi:thioredoxin reductase (NADPH)